MAFVIASYASLVLLFYCETSHAGSAARAGGRDHAKIGVWLTTTLLTAMFSWRVAVLVPWRPVRVAGLLSAAGVLASALVHTPVGLNATRLVVMFALPVLAAHAAVPRLRRAGSGEGESATKPGATGRWLQPVALVVLLLAVCWWQPPVVVADVRDIGNPTADAAYFAPLRDRLASQRMTGRLEIPPTRDYWEAAYLGDIPLARGWLRQADIDRNPLFFTTVPGASGTGVALTADSYRAWLSEQAVEFVAVPSAELSWPGRDEAALIATGLPYLNLIWSDARWRLYSVMYPEPIVAPPATLVSHTAAALTFDAPAGGDVAIRVRYSRWLTATGGAVVVPIGDWTLVRTSAPGRYTLTSAAIDR